jgi:uncharacterized Rossmann fold enzyme
MNLGKWLGYYHKIIEDFGFSQEKDRESSEALNSFLDTPNIAVIEDIVNNCKVNIFGAGPSLENLQSIPEGVNIVADGACTFLLEKGVVPDIIVTDLDGLIQDLLRADKKGSIVIMHAHGDNIERVRKYGSMFNNLLGTTQGRPFGNLMNFGGFTDGDRAVFIVEHFKPAVITLFGMDFEDSVGRYSFQENSDSMIKQKKLLWAQRLIYELIESSDVKIVFG